MNATVLVADPPRDDPQQEVETGGTGGKGSGGTAGSGGSGSDGNKQDQQGSVLSLAQLVGAPIHALVEAEAQAAMATANYIMNVGFVAGDRNSPDPTVRDFGSLRMASFTRSRQNADGSIDAQTVAIPLLSLLPIPALQIRDAQLDYTIRIVATELMSDGRQTRDAQETIQGAEAANPPATLRATFARDHRSERRRSTDMLLKMKVNIQQSDMPEGLARLLSIAGESVTQSASSSPKPGTLPAGGEARDKDSQ